MTEARPRRVTVTSPRTQDERRRYNWLLRQELHEHTPVGELYVRELMRGQLRLGLGVVAVLAVLVIGLPLLLTTGLAGVRVLGVPLAWPLLCGVLPLVFIGLTWWYVRRAERRERDFLALVADEDPQA
jgi:putative solute:sodium symporter small subunit